MGGDQPPHLIFEAVLQVSKQLGSTALFFLFAQPPILSALKPLATSSITFIPTEEVVEMEDAPLLAVRRKKHSSMAVGIRFLKENKIEAFLSTGNTGALVATSLLHLPMLPGVERPALLVLMPSETGKVVVLDVGANISPKPEHLVTYARLGSFFCQALNAPIQPKIGLLNIGAEEQKGTKELKETYRQLQENFGALFLGNIEGREVFQGKIDVLVTDGFTGNVFLKTSEGVSKFLVEYLHNHFKVPEIIAHLKKQYDYSEYPGAFLCGVDGVVVKCHGHSDINALKNGIRGAVDLINRQVLNKLRSSLS